MNSFVSVLLFGITRDLTGKTSLAIPITDGTHVNDLLARLHLEYPALSGIRSLLVAVNGEYAEPDQVLNSKDEVALIPPVSGG